MLEVINRAQILSAADYRDYLSFLTAVLAGLTLADLPLRSLK